MEKIFKTEIQQKWKRTCST